MDIEGKHGYLTEEEKLATGMLSPVLLSEIDTVNLIANLDERRQGVEAMQAADDDELTNAERGSIAGRVFELASDRRIIESLVGQVVSYKAEQYLKNL